jgi:hypothetical protein
MSDAARVRALDQPSPDSQISGTTSRPARGLLALALVFTGIGVTLAWAAFLMWAAVTLGLSFL